MDVIPLDPALVRGSHGRVDQPPELQPVLIGTLGQARQKPQLPSQAVKEIILEHLFEEGDEE